MDALEKSQNIYNSFKNSFLQFCQHTSTNSPEALYQSGFDGSDDKVFVSDDKRFVNTIFSGSFRVI